MGRVRTANPAALVDAARGGDKGALARLLSLVEQGGEAAREVGRIAYPLGGRAYTIGITGAPGAGKSTLTNALISQIRAVGDEVGVLAIDPSSPFTGGAILGDRVRMSDHALDDGVFIRSMATRGHLGGLALATPEAVRVLDAVGKPWVIIETVGVGQVEVEVAGAADTTVVVVNPGWGDAVQANKAGLLEIADLFVINKADRDGANDTRRDLDQMLELSHLDAAPGEWGAAPADAPADGPGAAGWRPPILSTIATEAEGVAELWTEIGRHREHLTTTHQLERRRATRLTEELHGILAERLLQRARAVGQGPDFDRLRDSVLARDLDPWSAADELLGSD